jgi:hypothetical protein
VISFVKRVTAQKALDGKKAALNDTVFVNGFVRVSGTGGGKPTAWRCGGRNPLSVEVNEPKKQPFHCTASKIPAFSARDR